MTCVVSGPEGLALHPDLRRPSIFLGSDSPYLPSGPESLMHGGGRSVGVRGMKSIPPGVWAGILIKLGIVVLVFENHP